MAAGHYKTRSSISGNFTKYWRDQVKRDKKEEHTAWMGE
jgi:hypothetical protein